MPAAEEEVVRKAVSSWAAIAIAFVLAVFWQHLRRTCTPGGASKLPGPSPAPVIGNLHQLPRTQPLFKTVAQWSKRYGDIWSFTIGKKRFVVLSTAEAMKGCLVEKGASFSSRDTSNKAIFEIVTRQGNGNFTFAPYGQLWRDGRKAAHGGLTKAKVDSYRPLLDERSRSLLHYLNKARLENGDQGFFPKPLFHYYSLSTILALLVDLRGLTPESPIMSQVEDSINGLLSFLSLESSPLTNLPGAKLFMPNRERQAYELREWREKMYQGLIDDFKLRKARNETGECIVGTFIDSKEETGMSDLMLLGLFSGMIGGGYETVALSLSWCILFLIAEPVWQERVFQEIHAVCKGERLPEDTDEPNLPLTRSFIYEVLRLRNPIALSLPHVSTKDETYIGYFIPCGSTILMDMYSIGRDPEVFEDPLKFYPPRHIPIFSGDKFANSDFVEDLPEEKRRNEREALIRKMNSEYPFWTFSAGRRVCVGAHLGDRELFLAFARILYIFKLEPGRDKDGKVVMPDTKAMKVQFTVAPADYQARFVLREHAGPLLN